MKMGRPQTNWTIIQIKGKRGHSKNITLNDITPEEVYATIMFTLECLERGQGEVELKLCNNTNFKIKRHSPRENINTEIDWFNKKFEKMRKSIKNEEGTIREQVYADSIE